MGTPTRKTLADISNLQQPSKPSNQNLKSPKALPFATQDYFEKLQMELNSGKDRLRALNHELGCKNGLLKARKVMSEVGADKSDDAGKIVEADDGNNNTCKTKRRRRLKNQSSISSTVKLIQAEEKVDNKRLSLRRKAFKFEEAEPMEGRLPLRRQSARFTCEEPESSKDRQSARLRSEETEPEPEPIENLYELDDDKFPVSPLRDSVVHESGPTSDTSVQEEQREGNGALKDEAQESRRRYTGRPSRRAADKVQSYKEITLKGLLMEELRNTLLYTTLELETTIVSAKEEIARRELELIQVKDVLNRTLKERNDAQIKYQKLILENQTLQQQLQKQKQNQEKADLPSSGSASSSEDHESKSSDSDDSTKNFAALSPVVVSGPILLPQQTFLPEALLPETVFDKLVGEKPLPEKGRLLKAVMEAGPLLQTLLLAGPLPQWQHPPPQLDTIEIPPVAISSPSPRLLHHQDSFNYKKRGLLELNEASDSSPPHTKYQKVGAPILIVTNTA
ncbi:hypothetical protein LWI29_037997 [Acer saccharum]|uniref:Shugoshin C-terminal domain-containing protein n=1 Tax=Acer saccharum TaxID=4024 RepID=A0AA39SPT3_ACESA|nr:hypothetical protein LWI29_037997 [Acer saccharum]